nr:uncharacterized protein LOC129159780 [Nothobranchius furzeri]
MAMSSANGPTVIVNSPTFCHYPYTPQRPKNSTRWCLRSTIEIAMHFHCCSHSTEPTGPRGLPSPLGVRLTRELGVLDQQVPGVPNGLGESSLGAKMNEGSWGHTLSGGHFRRARRQLPIPTFCPKSRPGVKPRPREVVPVRRRRALRKRRPHDLKRQSCFSQSFWTEPEGSPADPDECDDPEVPAAAEDHEGETMETGKTPLTVRKSVPTSPGSPTEGSRDARLQVRLARLDMEREERAQAKRLQMELEVRRMEIEADTAVRIRKLELEAQLSNPGLHITPTKAPQPATTPAFDISKCISLMPTFRETEVDSYFVAFERIAETLQWPRGVWSLLLQCKLSGRALEVLSALPDFKRKLPERLVTYLNEPKVSTLSAASLLADEFTLTHREIVRRDERKDVQPVLMKKSIKRSSQNGNPETRTCYYCHRTGHVLKDCFMLQKKNGKPTAAPKEVAFLKKSPVVNPLCAAREPDACFAPFILSGEISLTPGDADKQNVRILRDTGASQTLILSSALPFSASSSRGYAVLLQGIEMKSLPAQVHRVHLECQLVSGCFDVAICDHLPVNGVDVLLGNDVAGGKVLPLLEVVPQPQAEHVNCAADSHFYPACAVTRSQTQNNADIQLSDSVLMRLLSDDSEQTAHDGLGFVPSSDAEEQREKADADPQQGEPFPLTAETLSAAQKSDITLKPYFEQVTTSDKTDKTTTHYLLDNDVLVRCWPQPAAEGMEWGLVKQIIVPSSYREHVVSLAHESDWSGHLGVNKTYKLLLQHFFWPGMKKEVSLFCRRCHVCQMTGKPNQPIPPAPLQPIPVVSTPFDHVILDCVGPLPPSRTGKRFLLTLMCSATRFPEAIPLNSITTRSIIRALTHFFSIFGLPKVIQTDQGTNFKSKLFKQVTKTLGITHVMSSAYHPQSQGALERWHQTLKAMLTKYCLSKSKTWEEGLPFVLFAAREAVQDSLGFSPAQLVFGHTPRGPLKALKERFLFSDPPDRKVREYVQLFQKRLKEANSIAKTHLDKAKLKMKVQYDKTATRRNFAVGDKVLVLTPLSNSALSTKFEGPFEILSKLGDTNYVLHTPARRQKSRVCHVNMLKRYEDGSPLSKPVTTCVLVPDAANKPMVPQEAGEVGEDFPSSCSPRLNNSEALKELEGQITHLSPEMAGDLVKLIHSRKSLFVDVPTQTTVLAHHVEVSEAKPIRQHPYRASPEKRLIMKEETEYLLKNGFAIPSRSPWSSPCLVERKPDGTARFITDYRKLNAVTISDSYPLPRIDDCVDSVGPSKFVTKLDLLKGYWQVPLTEEASLMSAFVTPDAFLQYTVLPFGMKNAPATFQRLINTYFWPLTL